MSKTVEVPVAVLKQWEDHYSHRIPLEFYQELLGYIPEPPKVGDKITGQQFRELPPRSVAIDSDGDVWVTTSNGDATLIEKKSVYASHDDIVTEADAYVASDIGQGTLVYIGEEA